MQSTLNIPARPASLKAPLLERINLRAVTFVVVVLLALGYPAYLLIDTMVSRGIWDRGDHFKVELKALSSFELDPVRGTDEWIPQDYRALDGKRVLLTGEMVSGINSFGAQSDFDLVYSIQRCCLTGKPKIQHFIKCTMQPGREREAYFRSGLVDVMGILRVRVEKDTSGNISSVFRLDVESIKTH